MGNGDSLRLVIYHNGLQKDFFTCFSILFFLSETKVSARRPRNVAKGKGDIAAQTSNDGEGETQRVDTYLDRLQCRAAKFV